MVSTRQPAVGQNCPSTFPPSSARLPRGEYVSLHWVEAEWLKVAVASGEIRDRVVVSALAYLLLAGWVE